MIGNFTSVETLVKKYADVLKGLGHLPGKLLLVKSVAPPPPPPSMWGEEISCFPVFSKNRKQITFDLKKIYMTKIKGFPENKDLNMKN